MENCSFWVELFKLFGMKIGYARYRKSPKKYTNENFLGLPKLKMLNLLSRVGTGCLSGSAQTFNTQFNHIPGF